MLYDFTLNKHFKTNLNKPQQTPGLLSGIKS